MPFKSKAQQRFLYAHPDKIGGKDKLAEWSSATDYSQLPERKGSLRTSAKKVLHGK
jgi:hypothetical protein